jgi:hypothetical protein
MPSSVCEVSSHVTDGHRAASSRITGAASPICSRLSRITTHRASPSRVATAATGSSRSGTPNDPARCSRSSAPLRNVLRSMKPRHGVVASRAASTAQRVLPSPPGPQIVSTAGSASSRAAIRGIKPSRSTSSPAQRGGARTLDGPAEPVARARSGRSEPVSRR